MRQSHLILSNAAIIWASRILLLVPQLILVPFLIRTIGESGYGVYALVWSLMVSIDGFERSLQSGVVKHSAAFLSQGRIDQVNKVVSSSFVYSIVLAVLASTVILVTAAFYNDPSGKITLPLVVVGVTVLAIVPLTPYVAVVQARQRHWVAAIAETVSKYISLAAIVVWFKLMTPSVAAVVLVMAGMLFLSRLAHVPVAYRLVPQLKNRPSMFDRKSFRLIASFGMGTVLASLCLAANSTGTRWLMGALVSTRFVTHLAIILMPALLLSQIISAMTVTVMPATSIYEAAGNQHMLKELLIRGVRYVTISALVGGLVAALLMRNVLNVLSDWTGPEYEFLAPYALVLFASMSIMTSTSTAHHMLKGMGKLRAVVFIYLISLVVVPLMVLLVVLNIWHTPYLAVTSGLAAGHLVCGVLNISFCAKAVQADFREVFVRAFGQPLMVAAVAYPMAIGFAFYGGIEGIVGRTSVSILAVLLFFLVCYPIIATPGERRQIKEVIQLALGKLTAIRGLSSGKQGQ